MKQDKREWVNRPRSKEAGEASGAPKAVEVGETLMVMETDLAMQDADIYGEKQDQIQPSSKEINEGGEKLVFTTVDENKKQHSAQGW